MLQLCQYIYTKYTIKVLCSNELLGSAAQVLRDYNATLFVGVQRCSVDAVGGMSFNRLVLSSSELLLELFQSGIWRVSVFGD